MSQELDRILRPALEAVINPSRQARLATVASAHDGVGNITPDALAPALPAPIFHWYLSGEINSTGTNVAEEYELPTAVKLTGIRVRVKTAPAGNELKLRLTADNAEVDTVDVAIGETRGHSPLNVTCDAGVVLRLDVVTAEGEDATVLVSYGPASL